MTSTQNPQTTLIGAAAPQAGDLVAHTNPAGETLIGFILQVLTGGSRLRPQVSYLVRVGSGGGKRLTWAADDCTYTTAEQAAKTLTVGQHVYVYARGDWRDATIASVGYTRIGIMRADLRNGPHMVPAWQLMRVEA